MNINSRRSIHRDASPSAQITRKKAVQQEVNQNESQIYDHTESGSDIEISDQNDESFTPKLRRRTRAEHSPSVPRTPPSPKQRFTQNNAPFNYVPESFASDSGASNNSGFLVPLLCVFVLIIGLYLVAGKLMMNPSVVKNDNNKKECSFKELQKLYPEQSPKVWRFLKVGIESILNKLTASPGVYLFVHEGGERVKKLVRDIAYNSSFCFDHEMRPVEMENNDFNSDEEDYGYAIKKFKEKIQTGHVILIANLNEIPVNAARALHAICDTVSPIAPDVVIFLTLTVPNVNEGNIDSIAVDALRKMWAKLAYYELDPLITRVTDQVIALQS